jgi:uncharacterized BrkB/YihY/UPF0761 family membrane protein
MDNWHWLAPADNPNSWLFTAIPAAFTVGVVSFYVIYFVLPNRFPSLQRLRSLGSRATLGAGVLAVLAGAMCKFL